MIAFNGPLLHAVPGTLFMFDKGVIIITFLKLGNKSVQGPNSFPKTIYLICGGAVFSAGSVH